MHDGHHPGPLSADGRRSPGHPSPLRLPGWSGAARRASASARTLACLALSSLLAFLPFPGAARAEGAGAKEPSPAREGGKEAQKPPARSSAKARGTASLEWLTLDAGLIRVREKRLPCIVLVEPAAVEPDADKGGAAASKLPGPAACEWLDPHLQDAALRRLFAKYVLIRVPASQLERPYPQNPREGGERLAGAVPKAPPAPGQPPGPANPPADPPVDPAARPPADPAQPAEGSAPGLEKTLGGRLGVGGSHLALLVLNYWEEPVLAHSAELPSKTKLREELDRVVKVNSIYARQAKRVEGELEKSLYAYKLKNYREAVLKIAPFEVEQEQSLMDPYLKRSVNKAIQDYRGAAKDAINLADKLDAARKYDEAIVAFGKVAADFPFRDILLLTNKRKNEILGKMTFGRFGRP